MEIERIIQIVELLKKGFLPQDLLDERVFNPPFQINEVFQAICYFSEKVIINTQKGGFVENGE